MRTRRQTLGGETDNNEGAATATAADVAHAPPSASASLAASGEIARPRRPPPPPPPPPPPRRSPAPNMQPRELDPLLGHQQAHPPPQQAQQQPQPPPQPPQQQAQQQVHVPQQQEPPQQPQAQQAIVPHEAATQTGHQPAPWILNLRTPRQSRRDNPGLPRIIRIRIEPNMSCATLAACIAQALSSQTTGSSSSSLSSAMYNIQNESQRIAGLFSEQTGVFVSLESILGNDITAATTDQQQQQQLYCLNLEPRPPPPRRVPWWERPEVWIGLLIAVATWLWHSEMHLNVGPAVQFAWQTVYSTTIQMPLSELYRHGPWFLGWEGESLPRICARITYHGDASFWSRNLEECERIYAAKEEAYLRLARPVVYTFLFLVLATVLRMLLWEFQQHRLRMAAQQRPATDKDMVETYRAFQVLLRQVGRTLAPPVQAQQGQVPRHGALAGQQDRRRR